jgi:hypothetical protein
MPNHVHVLVRTGSVALSRLMQRWLGPTPTGSTVAIAARATCSGTGSRAFWSTRTHTCSSWSDISTSNPARARRPVVSLDELDDYRWSGHAVLLGRIAFAAQDTDFVLRHFGTVAGTARQAYRAFVHAGYTARVPADLDGGGLRRSAGGWQQVKALARGRERWAHDERVLGGGEFVERILREAAGVLAGPPVDPAEIVSGLCARFAPRFGLTALEAARPTLRPTVLDARAVISQAAVCDHGLPLTVVGRHLGVSKQSIARAPWFALRSCSTDDHPRRRRRTSARCRSRPTRAHVPIASPPIHSM